MRDGGREERVPYLPDGYLLDETDRELLILRRGDGSEVAAYSATGADPKEIDRAQGLGGPPGADPAPRVGRGR